MHKHMPAAGAHAWCLACCVDWIMSLPCFQGMQRSPVMTHIFRDRADFEANVGLTTWPAPTDDERYGFLHVAVPTPSADLTDASVDPRCIITNTERHAINFISYETETRCLTLRLSLARFNASKRVRGASIGGLPPHAPPGGGGWKYSLLEGDWIPSSTPAPTIGELMRAFPALRGCDSESE